MRLAQPVPAQISHSGLYVALDAGGERVSFYVEHLRTWTHGMQEGSIQYQAQAMADYAIDTLQAIIAEADQVRGRLH